MADVDQVQANEQAPGADAITGDAVKEMISEALATQAEQTKSELAGLNRRNSELEKALAETKAEAEAKVKSTMTEAEKAQHDWQLKMDKSVDALAKAQRETELERNKNIAREKLVEKGLPPDFLEFVQTESAEAIEQSISKAEGLFKSISQATAKEVGTKLGANPPTPPMADGVTTVTRAQWDAMPPAQKAQIAREGRVID